MDRENTRLDKLEKHITKQTHIGIKDQNIAIQNSNQEIEKSIDFLSE